MNNKRLKLLTSIIISAVFLAGCSSKPPANRVHSADDLAGKTIGVQMGTTSDTYATKLSKTNKAEIERYNAYTDAVASLVQGKIDCTIMDHETAKRFFQQAGDRVKILEEPLTSESYAIAVKKGNTQVKDMLNEAIETLKQNGTINKISSGYMNSEKKEFYKSPEGTSHPNGTLTLATNAEYPPYEYMENGEIVGIDPDIARAICDHLGYNLKIENMAFGSILSAVDSGKVDFGMSAISATEDRAKSVDFTEEYAKTDQVILVRNDEAYNKR